ncbi:MAG: ComEC/Rec2 family competence protein [Dehalococcoidia bacterium]|nr:MAG: ComEC/Rec2 family competence protein [Dehalococcoidia bacterium]
MRLLYLSLFWLAGICLGMWAGSLWVAVPIVSGCALIALMLCRGRIVLLILCLVLLAAGFLRYQSTISSVDEGVLEFYNDSGTLHVTGLVAADPERTQTSVVLRLEAWELDVEGERREVSGTVLVYAYPFTPPDVSREPPYYRYGDVLRIEGVLATPPEFEDFDWRDYLARQGIHSIIRYPERVELLDTGQGFQPKEWIYQLRYEMSQSLKGAVHEPQASLAQALVIGERSDIPEDLKDSLSRTSTAHIIAISGLHIGITKWVEILASEKLSGMTSGMANSMVTLF